MAKKVDLVGMPWGLASVWEEAFRCIEDRPLTPRNYCYGSELGGSFIDRYLKMNGHKYSNPFNFRSKGKMMAGKFFEGMVKLVLVATGILQGEQVRAEVELPNCLRVSGKLDFTAGGLIDWDEAKYKGEQVKKLFQYCFDDLYPFYNHMTDKILGRFQSMFTHVPIEKMIIENKSVSGFVYQLIVNSGKPRRGHPLQGLHYLIPNKDISRALIPYISRESVEIREFYITRDKTLLKEYREDVATMTAYYNDSIGKDYMKHLPPKDVEVHYEEASFKFVKNNKVEYSNYLTMLYGYKSIDHFKEVWDKRIQRWSAAFRRHVLEGKPTGKLGKPLKLTDENKKTIDEIRAAFPDYEKYLKHARKAGAFEKPEEPEEED